MFGLPTITEQMKQNLSWVQRPSGLWYWVTPFNQQPWLADEGAVQEAHPQVPAVPLVDIYAQNQVHRLSYDPNNMLAKRDFPDGDRFREHVNKFARISGGNYASYSPPPQTGLNPERIYVTRSGSIGAHPGGLDVWQMTEKSAYLANLLQVISDLLHDVPGLASIIPGALFHSGWKGVMGGAGNLILLTNEASGASDVLLSAGVVQMILAIGGEDYKTWVDGLHKDLTAKAA